MILKFPDINTLRLALTSGIVPPAVALTPASAGYDEQEALWVETDATLSRGTQNELKKLGVQVARASGSAAIADVSCWPELLPLQTDSGRVDRPEQTPYLFDLASGEELARFVNEMLRLGNDRQSYRWLEADGSPRVLLRVVGPPYYTLLRVLDRNGNEAGPRAFLERAPGVWVELGWTHPFVEHLKPAAGQLLFLQPPGRWTAIDEQPFHDIYEVLEFPLPNLPSHYHEGQLPMKVKVTPTLKKGGAPELEEMWVVMDNPLEEVNSFVQNEDEKILQRLLFAVGEKDGKVTIVLRARPSKLPPLELKLKADRYRPFSKMPNLFLPVGTYLHPKLRRDVVRNLFAEDPNTITWLARHDDGSCVPHRLAENAFRPLSEWVEYVLDHDRQPLQAWVQAAQFEFEAFICDEEQKDKPKKPPSDRMRNKKGRDGGDTAAGDAALFEYMDRPRKPDEPAPVLDAFSALPKATPNELQIQLRAVEEKFMALPSGLDTPQRQQLWPELASLNTALGDAENAGICWINALWHLEQVPAGWKWNWFRAEAAAVPNFSERGTPHNRSWVTPILLAPEKTGEASGDDLDRLFALEEPKQADVRTLAAYVVWASARTPVSAALVARLQPVQHFLEKNEHLLPVRAVWLAWSHLVHLARGDVLALARTRDRLLERLFHNGLRPELDLPSFLRFAGQPGGTRFRGVRDWFVKMCDRMHRWSDLPENRGYYPNHQTKMYIDLMFAFGLARLGEHDACHDLLNRAREQIADSAGDLHPLLFNAFKYRIEQALNGRAPQGALPAELLEHLERMSHNDRYAADRLRKSSRILEPDTNLDPYRHYFSRMNDLEKSLAELADLYDRNEVVERVARLLKQIPQSATAPETRGKILLKSLEIAPRVSEAFARTILEQVVPAFDALPPARDSVTYSDLHAPLLEKALFVAAHFDRLEHIVPLMSRFQALLEAGKTDYALKVMDELAGRCLRGLRKLGMREQIESLLSFMANLILSDKDQKSLTVDPTTDTLKQLRALLHVAGGWYYFNRATQAESVMQTARSLLLRKIILSEDNTSLEAREKAALAATYAATLGQAPREVAQKRLEELVTKLEGIKDSWTTGSYYSRLQLEIVEAVVLAVVSDDFTMGAQARRWLDDDEFLVRRRIHRDMKALMAHA